MTYEVVVTSRAKLQLYESALWLAENRDVTLAADWLNGFETALAALATYPQQHAVAPENEQFSFTIRQISYGVGKRPTHRAVYEIRGEKVYVLAIRHLAQQDLTPEDL